MLANALRPCIGLCILEFLFLDFEKSLRKQEGFSASKVSQFLGSGIAFLRAIQGCHIVDSDPVDAGLACPAASCRPSLARPLFRCPTEWCCRAALLAGPGAAPPATVERAAARHPGQRCTAAM